MENIGHVSEREVEERQKEGLFSEAARAGAKNGPLANLFLWQALMTVGFYIPELPRSQCTETELACTEEHFEVFSPAGPDCQESNQTAAWTPAALETTCFCPHLPPLPCNLARVPTGTEAHLGINLGMNWELPR